MAHVLLDRAKVIATSMSGNTSNYTLTNTPQTGFVDFTGVGDGNTTYYTAVDNAGNFEIGIGTFTLSTEVLTRTDGNVIVSSNVGNNNRVSWPSNSTPTVFISQPVDKAVFKDTSGTTQVTSFETSSVSILGDDVLLMSGSGYHLLWDSAESALDFADTSEIRMGATDDLVIYHNGTNSYIDNNDGILYITQKTDDSDIVFMCDDQSGGTANYILLDGSEGEVKLSHASSGSSSVKLTTKSTGVDITDGLTLTSTNDGTGDAPDLILYRNSANPANNDDLGQILFRGRNNNSEDVEYGKIFTQLKDVSNGLEDGVMKIEVMKNGTSTQFMAINGSADVIYMNRKVNFQNFQLSQVGNIVFEGSTDDGNETTLTVTDPTQDNTITLPNASGTVATTSKAIAWAMLFG